MTRLITPRDDSSAGRLHPCYDADCECLVLLGFVSNQQRALTHRVGLAYKVGIELLDKELQGQEVRGCLLSRPWRQFRLVDRGTDILSRDTDDLAGIGVRMLVHGGQHGHPGTGHTQRSLAHQVLDFRPVGTPGVWPPFLE
jgi:hypothetical protein